MSVDLFSGFRNDIAGESFRCLAFDKNAFVFEWNVQPEGYIPFEHIHLNQDEIFHIKQGEIRMIIDGQEYIGKAGEIITVPKGKRHIACNNKPELLSCIVEYKPGLDTYKFLQCFGGLTIDEDTDKKGANQHCQNVVFHKENESAMYHKANKYTCANILFSSICLLSGRSVSRMEQII